MILDEEMTFGAHIKKLSLRISPYVGLLYKLSLTLPLRTLKLVYHAYIGSNLQYLAMIWGAACKTTLEPLQILQNRALKYVFNKPPRFSTSELYSNIATGILPVKGIYDFQLSCFMFKTLNSLQFTNLTFNVTQQRYALRQIGELTCRRPRTRCGSMCIEYAGPFIFNKISNEIGHVERLDNFKHMIKKLFTSPQRLNSYLR